MQNFIFISPNFPTNYWQFCRELKNNGLNVLGIGDQPYEELKPELKASLNEYYKVNSLENYDEVYRAVAFFTFKYGRIDWLESNNEYWLERDAALRTDFHITSGFQTSDMPRIKYKSKMKEYYQKAGIATARYHMVDDLAGVDDGIVAVHLGADELLHDVSHIRVLLLLVSQKFFQFLVGGKAVGIRSAHAVVRLDHHRVAHL